MLPLFRGVWFWFYVTVQKRLTKEVFWCEKDILSDWVFLNFPILPFDVRLVFSSRKVCISQKRQSLLIYQTYQPAPQTDSTRQFRILKIILYFSKVTYCSLFLMRIYWFFCRFRFFPQLDNLASKEKKRRPCSCFQHSAVIHVFAQLAWQSAHATLNINKWHGPIARYIRFTVTSVKFCQNEVNWEDKDIMKILLPNFWYWLEQNVQK